MRRKDYERDDDAFPAHAYTVRGKHNAGVAFRVLGWETEPAAVILCSDCDFMAIERRGGGGKVIEKGDPDCGHERTYESDEPEIERTGMVVVVMIGDDAHHLVDPSDLTPIAREDYCGECGQIGCCCDGLDRSDES